MDDNYVMIIEIYPLILPYHKKTTLFQCLAGAERGEFIGERGARIITPFPSPFGVCHTGYE